MIHCNNLKNIVWNNILQPIDLENNFQNWHKISRTPKRKKNCMSKWCVLFLFFRFGIQMNVNTHAWFFDSMDFSSLERSKTIQVKKEEKGWWCWRFISYIKSGAGSCSHRRPTKLSRKTNGKSSNRQCPKTWQNISHQIQRLCQQRNNTLLIRS